METLRIVVDRGRCTGIGICESLSPDRFEVDDDGTLIVHDDLVTAADRDAAEAAVSGCPAAALSLVPAGS
ncbi:ferredoxin [Leifsonia naganoensis]|uniref:Ferredoxin n=1 Tax=Leifsonia naganoensis TaxID=150025 RepID=A0A853DL94_9MICO|nr:ferredoxin [Leifsonia naganoensis]NYK09188.1 ferredoxin [Leifsonia naganoensis]